jgi:hypothetical protein
MSCYDVLLEKYNAEQELAKVTFASINEGLMSLYEFVAQDVTLDFSVALESAEDTEVLKEASKEAVKKFFANLANKLREWAKKIVEKATEVAKKAAVAAANGGNAAIQKLLVANAKTVRPVIFKKSKYGEKETSAIVAELSDLSNLNAAGKADTIDKIFEDAKEFTTEDSKTIEPGKSVKTLHDTFVTQYIKGINYKGISDTIKKAAKEANDAAAKFEKDSEEAIKLKDAATRLMKAGTTLVTFAFQNLTVGMGNALKLAAACAPGKKTVGEKKAKEEKAAEA